MENLDVVNRVTFENKISFISTDEKEHTYNFNNLLSGNHHYNVICKSNDKGEVEFTGISILKK